tara:strand:+ start:299 stop:544 length:246 start_codon:yes stop_codon:yes gene_type:complete
MPETNSLIKLLSELIKNGILSSEDAKKEILNSLKFQREKLIDKLQIVTQEEFNALKKIVQSHEKQIKMMNKKIKVNKVKKS